MRILIVAFLLSLMGVALAQTPDNDTNRRVCALALNKAEADLASVLRSTHQVQGMAEITIEDQKKKIGELEAEIEKLKAAAKKGD